MAEWLTTSWTAVLMVILSSMGIYFSVILFTRLAGLRSFSKMSGFDFAMTVAIGSIVASSVLTKNPPLLQAIVALGTIYALQIGVAQFRKNTQIAERLVDNEPLLLMVGKEMFRENMRKVRVTENDVWSKLREANVIDLSEVHAVVFETTGDVSVLHGPADGPALDMDLLTGVRDRERFAQSDRYPGSPGR